jgi:predicted PurR-regulated permease PerM
MQLETVSAWATIIGTIIAFFGFVLYVLVEWPEIKKRIKGEGPEKSKRRMPSFLVVLAAVTVTLGIFLVGYGSTLKERLKDLAPALSIQTSQSQGTDMKIEVVNSGNITTEVISIINTSEGRLSLYGWTISDNGQKIYSLSQVYINPGQTIDLHSSAGVDSTTSIHMSLFRPVLHSGDVITLTDAAGEQRAKYQIP